MGLKKGARSWFKRSRILFYFLCVISVGIGVFLAASPAHAQLGTGWGASIALLLSSIAQTFIELAGQLLITLIAILKEVVQYNGFINEPAVVKSWILVRDVANMGFLIVFVAIAFVTILGVERYEWRRLLPKLLFMAVFINFSRTITGLIIDAAQVIMITFVNGFTDVVAGNLVRGFGLGDMLSITQRTAGQAGATPEKIASASILAVILLTIALIVVGVIVLMFVLRVLMLWLLIILSPLAFMLAATPGFDSQFQKWWSTFIKYAFMGPILAFFLWLSFSIMANVSPGSNLAKHYRFTRESSVESNISATITTIGGSEQLLSYGISISMLVLSLIMARSLGVAGGELAGTALASIRQRGVKLAKWGGVTAVTGGVVPAAAALGLGTRTGRRALSFAPRQLLRGGGAAAARFTSPESRVGVLARGAAAGITPWSAAKIGVGSWLKEGAERRAQDRQAAAADIRHLLKGEKPREAQLLERRRIDEEAKKYEHLSDDELTNLAAEGNAAGAKALAQRGKLSKVMDVFGHDIEAFTKTFEKAGADVIRSILDLAKKNGDISGVGVTYKDTNGNIQFNRGDSGTVQRRAEAAFALQLNDMSDRQLARIDSTTLGDENSVGRQEYDKRLAAVQLSRNQVRTYTPQELANLLGASEQYNKYEKSYRGGEADTGERRTDLHVALTAGAERFRDSGQIDQETYNAIITKIRPAAQGTATQAPRRGRRGSQRSAEEEEEEEEEES